MAPLPFVAAGSGARRPRSSGPDGAAPTRTAVSTAPMPATLAAKPADVWAVPVGIGHASPLVDGSASTSSPAQGEQEVAQALDLATGKTLWTAGYDAAVHDELGGDRARQGAEVDAAARRRAALHARHHRRARAPSTPPPARSRGATRSRRNSARRPTSARRCRRSSTAASLIAHVGGIQRRRAARLRSGDRRDEVELAERRRRRATPRRWSLVAGGVRQIVTVTKRTSSASTPRTGEPLWSLPFVTPYDQNAVTPVVAKDMVILSGAGTVDVRGAADARRRRRGRPAKVWDARRSRCT